jgi:hypothetical protein
MQIVKLPPGTLARLDDWVGELSRVANALEAKHKKFPKDERLQCYMERAEDAYRAGHEVVQELKALIFKSETAHKQS